MHVTFPQKTQTHKLSTKQIVETMLPKQKHQKEKINPNWSRDKIIKEIVSLGAPCYSGSCSEVYLEKAFLNTDYFPKERLPNAKKLGETSLMFLIHPTLTEDELDKTCEALTSVMEKACN